jgi:hypothetical protein
VTPRPRARTQSVICHANCFAGPSPYGPFDFGGDIGGGWLFVRRVRSGYNWHPANDQCQGTQAYGSWTNDITADATFSVNFSGIDFDEFLFATGDMSVRFIPDIGVFFKFFFFVFTLTYVLTEMVDYSQG